MFKRRRFKQTVSLQDRLTAFASEMREKAANAVPGIGRQKLLERERQAETALQYLQAWAESPGLQPPK